MVARRVVIEEMRSIKKLQKTFFNCRFHTRSALDTLSIKYIPCNARDDDSRGEGVYRDLHLRLSKQLNSNSFLRGEKRAIHNGNRRRTTVGVQHGRWSGRPGFEQERVCVSRLDRTK